jgi:hypothetical protein
MISNRVRDLIYAGAFAWLGIVLPLKALALLWQLRQMPSVRDEIISLCFLVTLSLRFVVDRVRRSE